MGEAQHTHAQCTASPTHRREHGAVSDSVLCSASASAAWSWCIALSAAVGAVGVVLAGGFISRIRRLFISKREVRMLMNGLDAAGKTTILYKLKLGEIVTTIPTIGFNVETVEYRNIAFTVWDVGGRDKIRPLWRHYYQNSVSSRHTRARGAQQRAEVARQLCSLILSLRVCVQNALIWVVDSNDRERLDGDDYTSTKEELHKALTEDELRDAPLLVFANKQDLPNSMKVQEITERLGLNKLRNRQWFIQGCCATSGDGLYEGLEWLSEAIKRQVVTPSRRNQYTAPIIPVAPPVYVPPIEPQPRKVGVLGVMDAISSENPNAFAVHALAPPIAAAAPASPPTPPLLAIMPPANYKIETVKADPVIAARAGFSAGSRGPNLNGVPRAPPMTRRFMAPRAPAAAAAVAATADSLRAPVSSRLFPSFPRTPEGDAHMQSSPNLKTMLKRHAESEPGSGSELVVVGKPERLESGEVSVVIEKQTAARHPSFDLKHSPLVSLAVRYPLSEIDHPLSKSEARLHGLTLDSPPSTPPRKRSAVVADSEFVIVERVEEEEDMVVVPHAQAGKNNVRLTMVEC